MADAEQLWMDVSRQEDQMDVSRQVDLGKKNKIHHHSYNLVQNPWDHSSLACVAGGIRGQERTGS
jgi:hypothetical protein